MIDTGNPDFDAIQAAHATLPIGAKQAIENVIGRVADPGVGTTGGSAPIAPVGPTPQSMGGIAQPIAAPAPAPAAPSIPQQHVSELRRLQGEKSGVDRIQSPIARIPLQVLSAIGTGLFPAIMANVPGTGLKHAVQTQRAQNVVNSDEAQAQDAAKLRETSAQAANFEAMPDLKQAQIEATRAKTDATAEHQHTQDAIKQGDLDRKTEHDKAQGAAQLRQHGLKLDETGAVVPIGREEMSDTEAARADLLDSQKETAEATAALKKAQAANAPAAAEMAKARIATAQRNSQIAAERLGLSKDLFNARNFGTDHEGNALPGAMIGDDNKPVGSTFQANVRPTGKERNNADLANSAAEQLKDMQAIITKRKDLFGPAAGRVTDFNVWLGSQDPDAQKFRAARTIAGDHLAGVFGGRSETALHALDDAIGRFKDNPAAVRGGLEQLLKANKSFIKAGTVKTAGSDAAKPAAAASSTSIDDLVKKYGGK